MGANLHGKTYAQTGRVTYQASAICVAVLTYVGTAFVCGIAMVPALTHAPDWSNVMMVAVGSTLVGMLASRALTTRLFVNVSGKAVAMVFTALTLAVYAYGWSRTGHAPSMVPTVQSLVLVSLSWVLFSRWPSSNIKASFTR